MQCVNGSVGDIGESDVRRPHRHAICDRLEVRAQDRRGNRQLRGAGTGGARGLDVDGKGGAGVVECGRHSRGGSGTVEDWFRGGGVHAVWNGCGERLDARRGWVEGGVMARRQRRF